MIEASETLFLFLKIAAFVFGAVWGSFANVAIYRIPRKMSVVSPASSCPHCGRKIRFYENIPVVSYIFLLGRCAGCRQEISIRYPVVELISAVLSTTIFLILASDTGNPMELAVSYLYYFFFTLSLLIITFIDIEHRIIPDVISIPMIIAGFGGFAYLDPLRWEESLLGIILGGGLVFLILKGYFLIRKREGIGGGDIKLMAAAGAFLGYKSLVFILFASAFQGLAYATAAYFLTGFPKKSGSDEYGAGDNTVKSLMTSEIPFGPFISLAALEWLFFHGVIVDFINRLFTL
ncbi:MAG: prepilin peptidase [Deltaproteobacteria bacterium]|nr:prepilin peptidase [Deltaproteobacteria bacterium]